MKFRQFGQFVEYFGNVEWQSADQWLMMENVQHSNMADVGLQIIILSFAV